MTGGRVLQRKCGCGAKSSGGDCAECRAKRELQRQAAGAGPAVAPPIVHQVLNSPGEPLDAATRAFLEPRFGHDFASLPIRSPASSEPELVIGIPGDRLEQQAEHVADSALNESNPSLGSPLDLSRVRLHTDARAAESAQAVQANAYTVGSQIVFGSGQYDPGSAGGRRLLAHELAHVAQQTTDAAPAPALQRQSIRGTATAANLDPIRADEAGQILVSLDFGPFSIFVPEQVILATRGDEDTPNLKVHVFFSAGAVQGNQGNDVLTHGLRGAAAQSDWVSIGIRSHSTISDQQIQDCLTAVGLTGPITALRLSGHSRGAFSLLNSVVQKKITTLSLIDRVSILDADEAGASSKTQQLINAGVDRSKIVVYEVNVRKKHIAGATYTSMNSGCMAAVGYVRLIQDAMVTQPGIDALVAANPAIQSQLTSLPLPDRGSFTTGAVAAAATPGRESIQTFCQTHSAAIQAILRKSTDPRSGLLAFINRNNLARFSPFVFDQGISAHHFFVAEVAHELFE